MQLLSEDILELMLGQRPNSNALSMLQGLNQFGGDLGMGRPHRIVPYIAELGHESGAFRYDHEIWGPTSAQKRYDTRTDLGNTAAADGDGKLYAGRGPIQVTGKTNYALFTAWAKALDPAAPDFVSNPDALLTDPWEGLSPLWYWDTNDLNKYSDKGDFENLTRRINGGLNGYADRCQWYGNCALVMLGRPRNIKQFQRDEALAADGIAGPVTRAKLHDMLMALADPVAETREGLIKLLQRELSALDLYSGKIDGISGKGTQGALKNLSAANDRITTIMEKLIHV